jgi:creatinine amidohydrolase
LKGGFKQLLNTIRSIKLTDYSNLTWVEIEDRLRKTKLVILPTGSVEQHGHHVGVGADWIQAWEIAKRTGEKCGALVLPVQSYGISGHHKEFPGVITLSFDTYKKVIFEILQSLNRYGVRKVLFINGHGGNTSAIIEACKEARDEYGILCAISHWWDVLADTKIFGHPPMQHAGYAETALTLASRPEAVRMDKAKLTPTRQFKGEIQFSHPGLAHFKGGNIRIPLRVIDVTDTGSMTEAHPDKIPGTEDYSMITPEFAEELIDKVVNWICEFIPHFEELEVTKLRRKYP